MAENSGQFVKNDPRRGTKPNGSQHHRTKFLAALESSSTTEEEFISKIVEMAREGNTTALNIAASRLWRESNPTFDVYELQNGWLVSRILGAIQSTAVTNSIESSHLTLRKPTNLKKHSDESSPTVSAAKS